MRIERLDSPAGSLAVRRFEGIGAPLLAIHGFGLHGGQFGPVASVGGMAIDAPDLPGHGLTTLAPVDLDTTITALAARIETQAGRSRVLGYSQGGRLAFHLAWRRPDLVESLVIVSAGPGLETQARAARRAADDARADRIERLGIDAYLDGWLDDPVFGTTRLDPEARAADRALRLENTAHGLAAAVRGLGQGALPRVPVEDLHLPILWIAGSVDTAYMGMMSLLASGRGEEPVVVPSAGHNVIAEAPGAVAEAIARAVDQGDPPEPDGPTPG